MSIPARQSTAIEFSIGPVLDADGVAFTGAVVGDFQIKKNGADWAALNASATATHTAVGNYDIVLTTSDTDTVGIAAIRISDTVNACATVFLQVVEEVVYDALYAASANTFTGAAGSSKVTGVVLTDTLTTYTGNTPQTGDSYALANGANGFVALKSDTAAILVDTGTTLDGKIDVIDGIVDNIIIDTAEIGAAGAGLTAVPWNASWDAEVQSEVADALGVFWTSSATLVDLVWDEVLTGATHNVTNSAGRRLRTLQTGGNYEGGMVWVDTLAGVAGTVTDENGVVTNPVDTLADARTLATAIPLKALHIANGSTISLASTTTNFLVQGHEWILALGGQDISGTSFEGANAITGTSSGTTDVQFEDCVIGNGSTGATLPPGTYIRCGFNTGSGFAFTGSAAGRYVFVDCYSNIAVGGASTPFFVFTGASPVMFRRYSGGANITFDASTAALTYECLGGGNLTVALAGSDLQARGTIRDMTITGMTSASLVEFVGTIGNLSLAGADGTVTLDGIVGAVVDSRTGTPTLNLPANTMGVVGNITGSLSGSVGSVTGAVGSVTGAVGSVTGAVGSVTGNVGGNVTGSVGSLETQAKADVLAEVTTALGTALTEAYRSTGATGSVAQLLYEIIAHLGESAIVSTTKTLKKLDGSTTAKTYTLDSATVPTSITETT